MKYRWTARYVPLHDLESSLQTFESDGFEIFKVSNPQLILPIGEHHLCLVVARKPEAGGAHSPSAGGDSDEGEAD